MKKMTWGLALLTMFACTQQNPNQVTLSGTIENPVGNEVLVSFDKQTDTLKLDETGKFTGIITVAKSGYASLIQGKESTKMFLIPGQNLQVSIDTKEFDETIAYTGENEKINNYLAKNCLANEKMNLNPRVLFALEEEAFIAKTDSVYKVKLQLLADLKTEAPKLNPEFEKLENARLLYSWAINYNSYPGYHAYLSRNKEYKPSEKIEAYKNKIDLNQAELLELSEYKNFISAYIGGKANKLMEKDESYEKNMTGYTKAKFAAIQQNANNKEVVGYLTFATTLTYIDREGANVDQEIMDKFKEICTNQEWIKKVQEKVAKWSKLAKGQPAFDFNGQDIEGKKVALSDLKGKYVYVDVWATWCGPCRGELPHLEKLEKEFHGKNVAFVSMSVDTNKEAWKKMVSEKQMKGIQLHAAKAFKSSICKDYMINGIPRFMLFDMEGNIINVNAPRPSGNIKEVLNKLENI